MKSRDGQTQPWWTHAIELPSYPPPDANDSADVIVVGAGIAGVTTAYMLATEGKRVLLLDEGPVGQGQTERTSAHLSSIIDDHFADLEKLHGVETARLAYQSHCTAIDTIERIVHEHAIDCGFSRVDAFLFRSDDDESDLLDREFDAALRAGVTDRTWVAEAGPIRRRAIKFKNQAVFQPMIYLLALANAAEQRGTTIRTGKRVVDVKGAGKGERVTVTLDDDTTLHADQVVVATNTPTPINDWLGIYTKQAAYRTYVIGFLVDRDVYPNALYWDTHDRYHYVRLADADDPAKQVLLVGGEDHKTGQDDPKIDHFKALTEWTRRHFPKAGVETSRWSGQVQEPLDGLAFIGEALTKGDGVFVITGDSGMGLTHATLGAILIRDLIAGRENPWAQIYSPSRKLLTTDFISETLNVTKQYADLITAGDIKSPDELAPGTGGVMRQGLHKLAIYKEPSGAVHKLSAICPHLKCVVHWNTVEHTWDCPCHGSRFSCTGALLIGPSTEDLPEAKESSAG